MELQLEISAAPPPGLERRRFLRSSLDAPARLCAADAAFSARCLDVSLGGALLRLSGATPLPRQILLYLYLDTLGPVPAAILARVVESNGRRLRVAFDPLPGCTAHAIAHELRRGEGAKGVRRALLN